MRISWKWLHDVANFDEALTVTQAAALLTQVGLEVETIETIGDDIDGVILAEVVTKKKHPKADKLQLVDVDAGDGVHTVVCGAPNVPAPGEFVVWAPPGSRLPFGELGKKKIKGIESPGMLCSEVELGIGSDGDGIMVLSGQTKGASIHEALGIADTVFDIAVPANRGDCLGHVGIARELIAQVGGALKPLTDGLQVDDSIEAISVEIDSDNCMRYIGRRVRGVTVAPSPQWMQSRLRAVGVRPISNTVDITNYVMFELGQPLHAFDASRVPAVVVRQAKSEERIVSLDDVERTLTPNDMLITDGKVGIAIAGVMGGADSEVEAKTTEVILESAAFAPVGVRKTAQRLALHSESSQRFARGVDAEGALLASDRAAYLMAAHCGARVGPVTDCYPQPHKAAQVPMRLSRLQGVSGIAFTAAEADEHLHCLGIEKNGEHYRPPSFRSDLTREIDLIEEVVRMHGFHQVPSTLPRSSADTIEPPQPSLENRLRQSMMQVGLSEAITYGFCSPERIAPFAAPDDAIVVQNPMNSGQSRMRPSLLPNLAAAVAHNQRHGVDDIALFELGYVFSAPEGQKASALTALADERLMLTGMLAGRRDMWLQPEPRAFDFYDIKAALLKALATLGYTDYGLDADPAHLPPYFHPGAAALVVVDAVAVGEIGELHPDTLAATGIDGPCFAFSLRVPPAEISPTQMQPISKFPAVSRDLSMLVDASVSAQEIADVARDASADWLEDFSLREVYDDPAHIPAGKKALLWSARYRSDDGTLTDKMVEKAHRALVEAVLAATGASQR